MHVGALLVFQGGDLVRDGKLDVERIADYMAATIPRHERYRQIVKRVPLLRHPVWVDDTRFDPTFHIRAARVDAPGSSEQLKELAARLLSKHLPRSRPLWEVHVIDGLSDGRFALLAKVHHCMVDGVGGMHLLEALLSPFPGASVPERPDHRPRRCPDAPTLLRSELRQRFAHAKSLVESRSLRGIGRQLSGIKDAAITGLTRVGRSPFASKDASRYRRFEWARFDLGEVKRIRTAFGGTVNDVLVAATTGAARRYLTRDGVDVTDVESLRAVLPVHTGGARRRNVSGNRVAMLLATLPLEPSSPRERMNRVIEMTSRLKDESHQSEGMQLLEDIADATAGSILSEAMKVASQMEAFDLILTNIPGPQVPLYLLGAKLESVYPVVPLMPRQTLGIALFSYDGGVFWGINADRGAFPDLPRFVEDLEASYRALRREADDLAPRRPTEPRPSDPSVSGQVTFPN